ncbi:MAG: hypothetical protein JNG88_08800 [Phycisphaerales bacterium]|nr:hypothetical protein [Phycisphaerales bacterium]
MLFRERTLVIAAVAVAGLALVACESTQPRHAVAEPKPGTTIACQLCYDEAVRALTGPPKHRRYKTVLRHRCPDCYSDVSIYEDNGTPMIKCARCVPEGVACDKCLPPDRPAN